MLTNQEQVHQARPYAYQHGDKPLAGYTIERAVGRGGFGEVYYALSDAGRQVALKVIQNYEQIELRGIQQCMNLKSPHLVSIFDVKHSAEKKPFVVMEYVSGPSLRDLIDESAGGLGEQKAAFFLREIGKGLTFLHECGIVHRDLKPGNIFYENGVVKIGDYGLSKAISTGMHSGQTITVGTVHYMAPEIGKGQYDQSVDIYALGILLYEMLTGQVPFFGASAGEVLMKHLADDVDLELVPDSFKNVIRKALAKDPQDRYQSVQEMIEEVFGSAHIRNSVSQFSPESLSIIAERVAQKAKQSPSKPTPPPGPQADAGEPVNAWSNVGHRAAQIGDQVGQIGEHLGEQVGEIGDRIAERLTGIPHHRHFTQEFQAATAADPVTRRQKRTLCLITMTAISVGTGFLAGGRGDDILAMACFSFLMVLGASAGMIFARWRWCPRLESDILRNIIVVSIGMIFATLLSAIMWAEGPAIPTTKTVLCAMIPLIFFNWWKITNPRRRQRASLGLAVGMAAVGFFVAAFLDFDKPAIVMGILAGIALVMQIASPFVPLEARQHYSANLKNAGTFGKPPTSPRRSEKTRKGPRQKHQVSPHRPSYYYVPHPVRLLWVIAFMVLVGTGLMLLLWVGMENLPSRDESFALGLGISSLLCALVCLIKSPRRRFKGWYSYLIRPVLMLLCLTSIITASCYLGNVSPRGEELLITLFLLIFPGIVLLFALFIPARFLEKSYGATAHRLNTHKKTLWQRTNAMSEQFINHITTPRDKLQISPYKQTPALLLAALPIIFPPLNGIQRFYVGKIGTGLLWLFTLGLFFVGQLVDVIMIIMGRFTDRDGRSLQMWLSENELARPVSPPAPRQKEAAMKRPAPTPPSQEPDSPEVRSGDRAGGGQPEQRRTEPAAGPPPSDYPASYYPPAEPFHPGAALAAFLGYVFLCLTLVTGFVAAVHFSELVNAGLLGREIAEEVTEELGPGWPALFNQGLLILATFLGMITLVLLVTARRRHGIWHICRAAVGIAGLGSSLACLSDGIRVANVVATGQHFNQVWQMNTEPVVIALVLFGVSIILLAWPPRKPQLAPPPEHAGQGV